MRTKIIAGVLLLALAFAGTAEAIKVRVQAGDLIVVGNGGFRPTKLPKDRDAPITLYGGGKIKTASGRLPPTLNIITFEWDKHGSVQTKGLPFCRRGQLEATTSPAARRACGRALVGQGHGKALVAFPEQKPFPVESPILVFNGPRKGRNPTVIAHAYTTVPVPTTYIVEVVIEKISKGVYGYRTKARIPSIANGAGIPVAGRLTVGRRWTFKGRRHSFVNARCATGTLQARGLFGFRDGTILKGTFFAPCQVRR